MTDARKALESARPQLYLDCDGVLADFDRAFEAQFGHAPRAYEEQNGPKVFWRNIREEAKEFYRHLPLMPGAQELYDAVKHLRPIILTGCPLGGWAELQKIEWAREHFPGVPLIPCMSKDKRNYCQPGDALVDDYLKYRDLWQGAGGVFIHHTDVATSIEAVASWNLAAIDAALASGEQGWRTMDELPGEPVIVEVRIVETQRWSAARIHKYRQDLLETSGASWRFAPPAPETRI